MEMTPVNSSNIHSIGYDAESSTLHVRFVNDTTYTYHNVPPEKFAHFRQAPSKMKYLNAELKGKYKHSRMT